MDEEDKSYDLIIEDERILNSSSNAEESVLEESTDSSMKKMIIGNVDIVYNSNSNEDRKNIYEEDMGKNNFSILRF